MALEIESNVEKPKIRRPRKKGPVKQIWKDFQAALNQMEVGQSFKFPSNYSLSQIYAQAKKVDCKVSVVSEDEDNHRVFLNEKITEDESTSTQESSEATSETDSEDEFSEDEAF